MRIQGVYSGDDMLLSVACYVLKNMIEWEM